MKPDKYKYMNDEYTLTLFVIYTIFYESLIWGLTACSIYFLNWNPLIIVIAIVMSNLQLKYKHFYVKIKEDKREKFNIDLKKD